MRATHRRAGAGPAARVWSGLIVFEPSTWSRMRRLLPSSVRLPPVRGTTLSRTPVASHPPPDSHLVRRWRTGGSARELDAVELAAGGDADLREDLPQVVLDRPGADEQAAPDLRVRETLARELGDQDLLGRQLLGGGRGAPACRFAGGQKLTPGSGCERLHAHGVQGLVRSPQVLARLRAAAPTAEPLAVHEVGPRELGPHLGVLEPGDRLQEGGVRRLPAA